MNRFGVIIIQDEEVRIVDNGGYEENISLAVIDIAGGGDK